jgi:hypothetical protein
LPVTFPPGPSQARDESGADGIAGGGHHNGNALRRLPGRAHCLRAGRDNHVDVETDELSGEVGNSARSIGRAVFDNDVLSLDIPQLAQALQDRTFMNCGSQHPDAGHPLGLGACCERPNGRRAADERDELAPPHEIPSSHRKPYITTPLTQKRCRDRTWTTEAKDWNRMIRCHPICTTNH